MIPQPVADEVLERMARRNVTAALNAMLDNKAFVDLFAQVEVERADAGRVQVARPLKRRVR